MRVHILGSGSEGNAMVLEGSRQTVLVDAGFGIRELTRRLQSVDVAPESVSALIITHEHHDHVRGAGAAARRFGWPVYATAGTLKAKGDGRRATGDSEAPIVVSIEPPSAKATARQKKRIVKHVVDTHTAVELDDFTLRFVKAPHDAREPVAIVATERSTGERIGIAYDIGHLTERFIQQFADVDILVLESNHDESMLMTGPYPWSLKQRVIGPNGHLGNKDAGLMARACVHHGLRHLVLCHLSKVNNRPDIALKTMKQSLRGAGFRGSLQAAPQEVPMTLGPVTQMELGL